MHNNYEQKENLINVSKDRWKLAQDWELKHWKQQDIQLSKVNRLRFLLFSIIHSKVKEFSLDDWNYWWKNQFNDYSFLPQKINSILELGSGPYTNVRLILNNHLANRILCTDPLIREYSKLKSSWISRAAKNNIQLVQHPAEQVPFADELFDLVIMINVLDHVFDAKACLVEAIRVTRIGGIFILGQDLTNGEDLRKQENLRDIGHPIRLQHNYIDQFILPCFTPIIYKKLSREKGRAPLYHYGTYIFAGNRVY